MVNFKKLSDQAKNLVEKRGGTDALKRDAEELKDIAKGKGSLSDKAKAAAAALKDPGAEGADEKAKVADAPPVEPAGAQEAPAAQEPRKADSAADSKAGPAE